MWIELERERAERRARRRDRRPRAATSRRLCSSSFERAIAIVRRPAVDGRGVLAAELAQHPRQRAEVILVAVRDHDRLDVVGALAQIAEVRQHEVDAEHVGGREPQPGVDDDDPAVVLDDRHVLADLAQPAERQDAQSRAAHARPRLCEQVRGARASRGSSPSRLVELDVRQPRPPTSQAEQVQRRLDAARGRRVTDRSR